MTPNAPFTLYLLFHHSLVGNSFIFRKFVTCRGLSFPVSQRLCFLTEASPTTQRLTLTICFLFSMAEGVHETMTLMGLKYLAIKASRGKNPCNLNPHTVTGNPSTGIYLRRFPSSNPKLCPYNQCGLITDAKVRNNIELTIIVLANNC